MIPSSEVWLIGAADEGYRLGLAAALRSAVEKLRPPARVHIRVLDGGLQPATRERLVSVARRWPCVASVEIWDVPTSRVQDLPLTHHFTSAAYGRLMLQEGLTCQTAVYLDSDVLVRGDLSMLAKQDLNSALAAAVVDAHYPTMAAGLPWTHQSQGIGAEEPYFNTGVMVVRPAAWREKDVGGAAIRYSKDNAETVRFAEQDGLNAVLSGSVVPLDPRWNLQVGAVQARRRVDGPPARPQPPIREAEVVHFIGVKPWQTGLGLSPDVLAAQCLWLGALWRSRLLRRSEYVVWLAGLLRRDAGERLAGPLARLRPLNRLLAGVRRRR